MKIAIALDWEETLAQTKHSDTGIYYKPRAWLKEFLESLDNIAEVSTIGIFTLGMEIPTGLAHLARWGFSDWCTDKFEEEIVVTPQNWKIISQSVDNVILVDDLECCITAKSWLGDFQKKLVSIIVPPFEESNSTEVLQTTLNQIYVAIASCKNK